MADKASTDLVHRVTYGRNLAGRKELPDFQVGDTVGLYVKVKEGEKERVQLYQGVVIKIQNSGVGRSFTVRKMASGVGVERTFPMLSPAIDRMEVISRGKVRRSRLFFLRGLRGRSARLNVTEYFGEGSQPSSTGAATASPGEASHADTKAKS